MQAEQVENTRPSHQKATLEEVVVGMMVVVVKLGRRMGERMDRA